MRFINTHRLFLVCFFIFYSQKVNGSSLNFDKQNLKLLTSEDGTLTNSTENDQTKYTITNNASGTQFTFNLDKFNSQKVNGKNNIYDSSHQPEDYLDVSQVTVVTTKTNDNNSNNHQNDSTQYTVFEHSSSFYFKFEPEVQCLEVIYANKLVWKNNSNTQSELYPSEVFFQRYDRRITVNFLSLYLVYEYSGGKWIFKSKTNLSHVIKTGLTIVTSDDEQGTNPKINDTSKYNVSTHDYIIQYDFKNGTYCTEFKLNNNRVWKYKPIESKKGFPKSLYFYTDLGLIFADFNDLSSLFRCTQQGCKCISNHKMNGNSVFNLKIITQDPNDNKKLKENDESQYVRTDEGYGHVFHLKKSAICTEIIYKNKVLWNYGYKSGSEYPEAVFFNTYVKMIVLKFSNFQMIYIYLDKWRFIIKPDLDPLSANDVTLYTKDGNSNTKEIDATQYELVIYPYNMALLYNLKQGSKCYQLEFKNKAIWKHNRDRLGDNYPTTIYINRKMQLIMVSGDKFLYIYGNLDKWRIIFRTIDKQIYKEEFEMENSDHYGLLDGQEDEDYFCDDDENDEFDNESVASSSDSQHSDDFDDSSDDSDSDIEADSDIIDEESVFSSKGTKLSENRGFNHEHMVETFKLKEYTRNHLPRTGPRRRQVTTPKELYKLDNENDDDDDDDDDDEPIKLKSPPPTKKQVVKSGKKAGIIVSIVLVLLALSIGGGITAFFMLKKRRSSILIENQVDVV